LLAAAGSPQEHRLSPEQGGAAAERRLQLQADGLGDALSAAGLMGL
tara:strand:- start:341 stop:478 length:138 start_codon:yes stop_codon:yes gene_type:complete